MKPKISFFVHDLAENPVGRTFCLVKALEPLYDIEILGFLMSGDDIHLPYRGLCNYKTVRCPFGLKHVYNNLEALYKQATGDVMYACKPLMTSFLPAVLAAGWRKHPLFLDIDDDHWTAPPFGQVLRDPFGPFRNVDSWGFTRLLHPLTIRLDGASVVTRKHLKRYGGVLLRHGPDEHEFDPSLPHLSNAAACRDALKLPQDRKLLLFGGIPRHHKGLLVLVEAMQRPECREWDLVLSSPKDNPDVMKIQALLGDRCHVLGFRSHPEMAPLLAACDAVPLPQRQVPFAAGQIPAKALEAMSMAKPIVASDVGDLGEILGYGERGWIVPPESVDALAAALAEVAGNPTEARRRGQAAREWYMENASAAAQRKLLDGMIRPKL